MTEPTTSVVIVDRVSVLGIKPEYCIHGETFCVSCGKACWLGSETIKPVMAGEVQPLCLVCARALSEMSLMPDGPSDHIHDHRRADGPHE